MLYTAAMLLVFYLFVAEISARNLIEKSMTSAGTSASRAEEAGELALSGVTQTMRSAILNQNIIRVVMAPRLQSYEKNVSFTRELRDLVQNDPLLLDAAVYIPASGQVFAAGGGITSFAEYAGADIFARYLEHPDEGLLLFPDRTPTGSLFIEGRLFLLQDFPGGQSTRVGTLMVEVDTRQIVHTVRGRTDELIFLYHSEGMPIGEDYHVLMPLRADVTAGVAGDSGSFTLTPDGEEYTYFYSRSDKTGWIYLYPVNSRSLRLSAPTLLELFPFLPVFLALILGVTLLVTWLIYRPVDHLMKSIAGPDSTGLEVARHELDYLSLAWNDAVTRQETSDRMVKNAAPVILEHLFAGCLGRDPLRDDQVAEMLTSVPSPFHKADRYIVVVASVQQGFHKDASAVELDLCAISCTNLFQEVLAGQDSFIVRMDESTLAVALRFPPETSALQVRQEAARCGKEFLKKAQPLPYGVRIGRGRVYGDITDLKYSYQDAWENLSESLYREQDKEEIPKLPEESDYDRAYFAGRARHLAKTLGEGDFDQATELAGRIALEIAQASSPENARAASLHLADTLIEKLLEFRNSANDPLLEQARALEQQLEKSADPAELGALIHEFSGKAVTAFEGYHAKLRQKHILKVKELVEQQYADPDLSQNMAAQQAGVHPSYLSRLFKENLGVSFVDYVNEYRVEMAKQLLRATSLTVKEIGYKTGFQSAQTFFRVFKKHDGQSPGQYREQERGEESK